MEASYDRNDTDLLQKLKNGDTGALDGFYVAHRVEFVKWADKMYGLDAEEAVDIYQDSIIILYENVVRGKLVSLDSTLKTYMFAIGKNLVLKKYNKDKKLRQEWEHMKEEFDTEDDSAEELNVQQEAAITCLEKLADPCRTILKLYYYHKLSMKAIAEKIGYKNEDVVKSQKVRCLKSLKNAVLEATRVS